jgi:hypothetical protein
MGRILVFVVAAVAVLALLWFALWSVIHLLVLAFWVVLVVLVGVGLFRISRRPSRRARQ